MNSNNIFYHQNFGVEVELILPSRMSRADAARIIARYFGTNVDYRAFDGYDTSYALDRQGRKWKCSRDGSLSGGTACELVTPILSYSDLDDLQEIIRLLRHAGAKANSSCGIHVHVDGANHDAYSLTRLLNLMLKRQDLIYDALAISDSRAANWCCKTQNPIVRAFRNADKTKSSVERVWYSSANDYRGYTYNGGIDHQHYNGTRYHGLNLHAYFTKGTVEFRLFNGSTHAGEIKAYVQFCLAMSAYAIGDESNHTNCNARFMAYNNPLDGMEALLNRLDLTGREFETCRMHLTKNLRR